MPAPVYRSQILKYARQKAGMDVSPSDTFVTDEEGTYLVDRSACALYDQLIVAYGEDYYLTETSYTVPAFTGNGENIVLLPDNFYQLSGCYVQSTALYGYFDIAPFMQKDVAFLRTQALVGFWNPTLVRYRLRGQQGQVFLTPPGVISADQPRAELELLPEPRTPLKLFVRYIPVCTRGGFSSTSPTVDQIYDGINGWEEWCILDVAIQMMLKEERDTSALMAERARVEARIADLAGERDAVNPERVVDVQGGLRLSAQRRNGGARTRWWYP